MPPPKAYSQLTISGNGQLVVGSGSYVVAGKGVENTNTANEAIELSGILRIVAGDFTNNATAGSLLSGNTGTVEFAGSTAQAINGSRATYFNNLLINNTSSFFYDSFSRFVPLSDSLPFGNKALGNIVQFQAI